ncbi:hypothetical protein QEH59_07060 [Coraliomargarita sp. SDUM461004]|uniref:Uncharacterized protein n=1 Tax=Thalassobacterium sedimentorum TaxID=3041258 RepID=A0ABU1AH85_9BACT|nr:hypothetical protein [Coraliomargarita sp. SDUM461004]MDQ8194177.1 hypothetical protein [Coraliomargarita sp. SDUM461004]
MKKVSKGFKQLKDARLASASPRISALPPEEAQQTKEFTPLDPASKIWESAYRHMTY